MVAAVLFDVGGSTWVASWSHQQLFQSLDCFIYHLRDTIPLFPAYRSMVVTFWVWYTEFILRKQKTRAYMTASPIFQDAFL